MPQQKTSHQLVLSAHALAMQAMATFIACNLSLNLCNTRRSSLLIFTAPSPPDPSPPAPSPPTPSPPAPSPPQPLFSCRTSP